MCRRVLLASVLLLTSHQAVSAQQWARDMFQVTSHDFGTVARGAATQYAFRITNSYAVDVHIASVRTTCSCTTPTIAKQTLSTYEEGAILATFNTDRFLGHRSATVTVTFDKPRYAEVQLHVRGAIRSDVQLTPRGISFGSIDMGSAEQKWVDVRHFGSANWRVVDVRNPVDFLDVEVRSARSANGRNGYRLLARIKENAPVGYFRHQVTLVTNDRSMPHVPVQVDGRIVAPVTVTPPSLFLGAVPPGQKVTKRLVVRAKTPFRVVAVEPEDDRFEFELPDTARKVHLISLTFTAGDAVEKVVRRITVATDLAGGAKADCTISAAVVEPVVGN